MFDTLRVGRQAASLDAPGSLAGYSAVILKVTDEVEYRAGDESKGRVLSAFCPWGTQKMADAMLRRVQGHSYQPYTAASAVFDPSGELGDAVEVKTTHGGIYSRKATYGKIIRADLSAPHTEEINEKTPYKSTAERETTRKLKNMTASLKVQADKIAAESEARREDNSQLLAALTVQAERITQEVSDRAADTSDLRAALTVQASEIAAKVERTGGNTASFGWSLTADGWTLTANGGTVLEATKAGLVVTGEIRATTGEIGDLTLKDGALTTNNQSWGGTNTQGVYIGNQGIQLGKNFKVDSSGNVTANTLTLAANKITYGGDSGYLSGGSLSDGSVYGGKIAGSTLGTSKFSGGVNTSLGYADFSNGVFNGWNKAANVKALRLYLGTKELGTTTISYKDPNGATRTMNVVGWRS